VGAALEVLLVEDNPVDARVISSLLAESGEPYEVATFSSLEPALLRLRRGPASVVLLDLHLPDSQGLDTAIRVLEAHPEVAVVVLTGLDDEDVGVLSVQEGAQDYLVKGQVTPTLLRRTLRYAVQRNDMVRHLRRALEEAEAWKANLRNLLHLCPDGVVVVGADGRACFVNAEAERLLGRPARDLLGAPFGEALRVDETRRVALPGSDDPVELRTQALEWSGDPAWLIWMRPVSAVVPGR
jgi:CheY-like chemotaxis protein